jgi:hypothetical protein
MNSDNVLDRVKAVPTPKGVRMGLRVYVYPDGHGNIAEAFPVKNVEEAVATFRTLWEECQKHHGTA